MIVNAQYLFSYMGKYIAYMKFREQKKTDHINDVHKTTKQR